MRFPGSGGGDRAGMIYASGVVLGWCLLWGVLHIRQLQGRQSCP